MSQYFIGIPNACQLVQDFCTTSHHEAWQIWLAATDCHWQLQLIGGFNSETVNKEMNIVIDCNYDNLHGVAYHPNAVTTGTLLESNITCQIST